MQGASSIRFSLNSVVITSFRNLLPIFKPINLQGKKQSTAGKRWVLIVFISHLIALTNLTAEKLSGK